MKLAVSNIAWPLAQDVEARGLLRARGIAGVEVAPTVLWPNWEGASSAAAGMYRKRLADEGLCVPSLQAILFGKPELALFGTPTDRSALLDHLRFCFDLAVALGAGPLVFGAPKQRRRGSLSPEAAFQVAQAFFSEAGAEAKERGVCLCIEPNPPQYGCDFVTTSDEGAALVRAVGSPGFGLHLDAAGMHLVGEDGARQLRAHVTLLRHFHASEPELGAFRSPRVNHKSMGASLRAAGYAGWVSIEMRATANPLEDVVLACDVVRRSYPLDDR